MLTLFLSLLKNNCFIWKPACIWWGFFINGWTYCQSYSINVIIVLTWNGNEYPFTFFGFLNSQFESMIIWWNILVILWNTMSQFYINVVKMDFSHWEYFKNNAHNFYISLFIVTIFNINYSIKFCLFHIYPVIIYGTKVSDGLINLPQVSTWVYRVSYHYKIYLLCSSKYHCNLAASSSWRYYCGVLLF